MAISTLTFQGNMHYEKLVALLLEFGFTEVDGQTEPTTIDDKEFTLGIAGGKRMVTIGSGFAGDVGCYMVWYFDLHNGEYLQHSISYED